MFQDIMVFLILAGAVGYSIASIAKIFKEARNRKDNCYCSGCGSNDCCMMND